MVYCVAAQWWYITGVTHRNERATIHKYRKIPESLLLKVFCKLLARDVFLRTNRRTIAMMFVRPSVRLSVCLGWVYIVMMLCA